MKKQRIYISGPMTSSDSEEQALNVQAFNDCALLLRDSGCRPEAATAHALSERQEET